MYHEYSYQGRLQRRNSSGAGRFDFSTIQTGAVLGRLMLELRERLGPEEYYRWASGLGMSILLDQPAYARAIREKLAEIDTA
jgi:hypothetical protein